MKILKDITMASKSSINLIRRIAGNSNVLSRTSSALSKRKFKYRRYLIETKNIKKSFKSPKLFLITYILDF